MQYLSYKDHHRVSASVMKAEVQVKRRRQALHLDRMTLEEQQVEEEGEMYVAGRFESVFLVFFLPAFFKATTYQRASLSVCVQCECWQTTCNCL